MIAAGVFALTPFSIVLSATYLGYHASEDLPGGLDGLEVSAPPG